MAKAKPVASGRRSTGQSISRDAVPAGDAELRAEPVVALARGVVCGPDGADGEGHRHDGVDGDDHDRGERRRRSSECRSSTNQPAPMTIGGTTSTKPAPVPAAASRKPACVCAPPRKGLPRRSQRQRERDREKAEQHGQHDAGRRRLPHGGLARQAERDRPPARTSPWRRAARRRTISARTISAALRTASGRADRNEAARRDAAGWRRSPALAPSRVSTNMTTAVSAIWSSVKRHRPRRIEIEAQRLVDRDLQRRRGRSAAERQHDGEGGDAEHEDQAGDARQGGAHGRPFDQRKDAAGPMPSWLASRHWSAGSVSSASRKSRVASGRLKKTCATRMPDRP